MRFGTIIRKRTPSLWLMLLFFSNSLVGQKSSPTAEPREMIMTEQGLLAINTPQGWARTEGPGLAYFIPQGGKGQPRAWIYISSAAIGPNEEAKDLNAYIASDIAGFKERFKGGLVQQEAPLYLTMAKVEAPVYTFRSGEKNNVVEQVVYVGENNRVLTLVLSAKDQPAFDKALSTFKEFAKSYAGSITITPNQH